MRVNVFRHSVWTVCALLLWTSTVVAKEKKDKRQPEQTIQGDTLARYLRRIDQLAGTLLPTTPGSLWRDDGKMANLSGDYKAMHLGDILTILVVQDVTAQNAGSVQTSRTFNANSGITALGGHIGTSGVADLFTPTSTQALTGKSQAATTSTLRTSLSGRIVAVLPNGLMVVEAERQITMNNERQTVLLRGLVRPGDVSPTNTVVSNAIGNLELELKGKGVLSDGVHPPNLLVRWLLRLVGF